MSWDKINCVRGAKGGMKGPTLGFSYLYIESSQAVFLGGISICMSLSNSWSNRTHYRVKFIGKFQQIDTVSSKYISQIEVRTGIDTHALKLCMRMARLSIFWLTHDIKHTSEYIHIIWTPMYVVYRSSCHITKKNSYFFTVVSKTQLKSNQSDLLNHKWAK